MSDRHRDLAVSPPPRQTHSPKQVNNITMEKGRLHFQLSEGCKDLIIVTLKKVCEQCVKFLPQWHYLPIVVCPHGGSSSLAFVFFLLTNSFLLLVYFYRVGIFPSSMCRLVVGTSGPSGWRGVTRGHHSSLQSGLGHWACFGGVLAQRGGRGCTFSAIKPPRVGARNCMCGGRGLWWEKMSPIAYMQSAACSLALEAGSVYRVQLSSVYRPVFYWLVVWRVVHGYTQPTQVHFNSSFVTYHYLRICLSVCSVCKIRAACAFHIYIGEYGKNNTLAKLFLNYFPRRHMIAKISWMNNTT